MNNASNFVPSSDAVTLAQRAAAAHVATAHLLQVMLLDLPSEKHKALDALLATGGRVGIEATVDGTGLTSLCMVGFTSDGDRLLLSTVQTPATTRGSH
jgi:hypothetical protein